MCGARVPLRSGNSFCVPFVKPLRSHPRASRGIEPSPNHVTRVPGGASGPGAKPKVGRAIEPLTSQPSPAYPHGCADTSSHVLRSIPDAVVTEAPTRELLLLFIQTPACPRRRLTTAGGREAGERGCNPSPPRGPTRGGGASTYSTSSTQRTHRRAD